MYVGIVRWVERRRWSAQWVMQVLLRLLMKRGGIARRCTEVVEGGAYLAVVVPLEAFC